MRCARPADWMLLYVLIFGAAGAADAARANAAPEVTKTAHAKTSRSHAYPASDHYAMVLNGTEKAVRGNKLFDVFVYDADIVLLYDDDGDGFFHGLEVSFDVDTTDFATTLYARLYLRRHAEPWELYFQTPSFTVFGTSPDDDYFVATELLSGYQRGQYDLMIELYEAANHALVAQFGPWDSAAFGQLPLEDLELDRLASTGDAISYSGGGGALGLLGLAMLCLAGLRQTLTKRDFRHE